MMLYSRRLTLRGPQAETMAWIAEITASVNAKTNLDIGCWMGLYGLPVGSVGWSARVESHVEVAEMGAALAGDAAFAALVDRAAGWVVAPPEDSLRSLVSGGRGDAGLPAIGSVALMTTAVLAQGKLAEGMAWCMDIGAYAADLTGVPVAFFSDVYGTFGAVTWTSVSADMATVDKSQALIAGDAEYIKRVSAGSDLFIPGSGYQALSTRIA